MQMKTKTKLLPLFMLMIVMSIMLITTPLTASAVEPEDEYEYEYDYDYDDDYWYWEEPAELPDEYYQESGPVAFTPAGTGTVIDNATDEDGKEFYTIETPDGNIFYLIIDKQRHSENVYFLGAVTEEDLMSLAQPGDGKPISAVETSAQPEETEPDDTAKEPAPASKPVQNDTDYTMIAIVAVAVIGAGGIGYYFKIVRPKKEGTSYDDDYGEWNEDTEESYSDREEEDSYEDEEEYEEEEEYEDEGGYEEDDEVIYDVPDTHSAGNYGSGNTNPQDRNAAAAPAPAYTGNRSNRRRRRRKKPNYNGSGR